MSWTNDYLDQVRAVIASNGWAVQCVEGRETYIDHRHIIEPQFAYSVGLTVRQRPEIIIVGSFDPELVGQVINSAIISAEEYGEEYADQMVAKRVLQDYSVVFREVTPECTLRVALVAKRLYGNIRLLQMFLPDEAGRFPWQPDCEGGFDGQAALDYISPPPGLIES
jgi:Domain of unknown function (DUF4262)